MFVRGLEGGLRTSVCLRDGRTCSWRAWTVGAGAAAGMSQRRRRTRRPLFGPGDGRDSPLGRGSRGSDGP